MKATNRRNTQNSSPSMRSAVSAVTKAQSQSQSQVRFSNTPLSNSDSFVDDESDEVEGEAEVMGELKSFERRKDRNFDQTVEVLRARLTTLKQVARIRLDLCKEDLNAFTKKSSKRSPRLMEDFEEGNTRMFKEKGGVGIKDNLVSAEGVYIDPVRLAIRTKLATETGRKLEAKLEESFGIPNLRELKGKKSKTSNRAARSKKSEARRFEIKKKKRQDLEKTLQSNMESMVLRSVLEEDMEFKLPDHLHSFPIPVKWSAHDPRSATNDNLLDGVMDPDLLLQYGLERITLPSGEHVFKKLMKQPIVHSYFVHLFWFIKIRFFQREGSFDAEKFLLGLLGSEYVSIVEMLSQQLPAEHEKDFIFKFFPYIISNALYYAFFYLCPGARHLYTKAFRKNIILQVVQVLFGYQLCPISLKVDWVKLFPDEALDDDEGDDMDINTGSGKLSSNPASRSPSRPGTKEGASRGPQSSPIGMDNTTRTKANPVGLLETDGDKPLKLSLSASAQRARAGNQNVVAGGDYQTDGDLVDPLSRTALRPPIARVNRAVLFPRQQKEKLDASNISPVVQEFLGTSSASGGKRQEVYNRTVPVSWCVSGGSDTHRKKVIPKELHDELSSKVREMNKTLHSQTVQCQKEELKALRKINKNRLKVLNGGPAAVGKFSLDLMKRRKNGRTSLDRDNDASASVAYKGDQDEDDDEEDMEELFSL